MTNQKEKLFTNYQIFMIAILAIIQFTVILDFMVLSPLGAILMPKLGISTAQFGFVVSAYAFSAGLSGLFAAGFADKFDRKKFLLFFYVVFLLGIIFCAMATTYQFLLAARIVTGIFGGVIGSVGYAIITDLFNFEVRGRVMGFVQMAFASSQILGLPIGLYLANAFDWHAPFWLIAGFGIIVGLVVLWKMEPIDSHVKMGLENNAVKHLWENLTKSIHLRVFISTSLLATGGFMMMPFGSAYSINNLGMSMGQLPTIYFVSGLFSILTGPILGKFADSIGHFRLFLMGTILAGILVYIYCNLGISPLWLVIVINVAMFTGIMARMVSSGALISAIPAPKDRGAFMSINSSIQQISGGISTFIAGLIVHQNSTGYLENYPELGWTVITLMIIVLALFYWLSQYVNKTNQTSNT
jgi:predicted MFS family arabinose efflux permease